MSINYIIASSTGNILERQCNDPHAKYTLQRHLQVLEKILPFSSNIGQITICRQDTEQDGSVYYDIEAIVNQIRKLGVKVEVLPVDRKGISYYQYFCAYQAFPNFEYYLLMEDDWIIHLAYTVNWDTFLLDSYKRAFQINELGFLNAWSPTKGNFVGPLGGFSHRPFHSAISTGLFHRKAFEKYMNDCLPISVGQFDFSNNLLKANIKIKDFHAIGIPMRVFFYSTNPGSVREFFSEEHFIPPFFVPIQYLQKRYKYQKMDGYTQGPCEYVENKEGIF